MAVVAAAVGLSACGSTSKTTVTETVTQPVGGGAVGTASAHHKSTRTGTRTSKAPRPSPSQSGSTSGPHSTPPTSTGSGPASPAPLTRHVVDNVETVHITSRQGTTIIQEGVVTGAPIGRGTIVLHNTLKGTGVVSAFEVRAGAGSVRGLGNTILQVQGTSVHYRGTARLIGGTGAYRRVRAAHLTVTGTGSLSGDTTLHVTGVEWY
jgi:hypothetical protein